MKPLLQLLDRTAVLFLGIAAGAAIGYAFGGGGEETPVAPVAPVAAAKPVAPPRPAAPKAPAFAECAMPFQQQLLTTVAEGRRVRIGVFGDSYGDGVWAALYRQLPASDQYEVIKYSQQSTGFTRYQSLNLEQHDHDRIVADPVDIAVISFGANDTQGVMHKGKYAPLLSPEWQAEIGARVDAYVRMLRSNGAMVYWVGLPRMRKPSFDADIQGMNDFYTRRMRALNVPFIATAPLVADPTGGYAPYLNDPATGKRTLIRANDGIHMSMTGYVWITRGLAERIRAYVGAARATAGANPVATAGDGARPGTHA